MIMTVTLNPALDLTAPSGPLTPGGVCRYEQAPFLAGGKGIHVTRLRTALGVPNKALGFLAGFTGRETERQLIEEGCAADFIHLPEGCTRVNLKLIGEEGATELHGQGPPVSLSALEELMEKCAALSPGDTLVLAGSVPSSLPEDAYGRILRRLPQGVHSVVDAAGEALGCALAYRPFFIKPNLQELSDFFSAQIESVGEAAHYARELQHLGAQNVVVSLGEKGALLVGADGRCLFCRAAKGQVLSAVGAGDSLVAGFLYGWRLHGHGEGALRWAVAAGCATAFSHGIATGEQVKALYPQVGNPSPV